MDRSEELTRRGVLRGATITGVAGIAGAVGTATADQSMTSGTGDFEAGAARVDASPRPQDIEDGVYLGGFGIGPQPSRQATGNHDGVSVRALAVTAGDETTVVSSIDVTGFGNVQHRAIREQVAERTGLEQGRILIHSTHTHAGPDFQGLWGGVPEAYRTYVVDRASLAIVEALEASQPARAFVGSVDAQDLASNRRYDDDRGTVSELTALQFRQASGGGTIGTLVNFGAHPTIIGSNNQLVATDYVGPLERRLEEDHGGVAVYLQSAIGDATARRPPAADHYESARQYGHQVAARATDALAEAGRVHAGLTVRDTRVRLPIDNCVFKAGFESGLLQPYYDGESVTGTVLDPAGEAVAEASPAEGEEVRRAPETGALAMHTPVARLAFGDGDRGNTVELVTIPGEAVTALGRDLKTVLDGSGADATILAGLTQNSLGYLIPKANYAGGYEETVSLGPDTAPLYRDAITDLYDLDRATYDRLPPGPENVCPEGQAAFQDYAGAYLDQFTASDGPMGIRP
jgi:hypothetical protein